MSDTDKEFPGKFVSFCASVSKTLPHDVQILCKFCESSHRRHRLFNCQ